MMASTNKAPEIGAKKSRQSHNNKVPPDAPRRNLSSFVIFANTRRKELKALYPDRPYPAIQSDISVEWEKMDDEGKEPWKKLMALDKERYKREMELYRKYGSNWVWVVGHQKRKELGLTVEDCTKFEFLSSTGEQGGNSRSPQSRSDPEDGRFTEKTRHHNDQILDVRHDDSQASIIEIPSPFSIPGQSVVPSNYNMGNCNSNTQFYGIPALSPGGGGDILDNSSQGLGDLGFLGLVDVFSPTVFDGFGLDIPWSETCEWYDQQ
ncbi:High mobility group [Arthrobotrys conoides]|uniref:High mobility group n=1 Tax=Arthrobotrys conoides TaxID=74498 RepID=A0AAN8RUT6_9PEZI